MQRTRQPCFGYFPRTRRGVPTALGTAPGPYTVRLLGPVVARTMSTSQGYTEPSPNEPPPAAAVPFYQNPTVIIGGALGVATLMGLVALIVGRRGR